MLNGLLELWYGSPDDPEADIVMKLDPTLVPACIAALRAFEDAE